MKNVSVLIPTYNRAEALAVTLTALGYQKEKDFDVVISNQFPADILSDNASVQTAIRFLKLKGHDVNILTNLPARGMAHQRQFLLDQANTPYCLFLDDDLILEDFVIKNMLKVLKDQNCGFVGSAVIGLSFSNDVRPHQQHIEFWEGTVAPETVVPKGEHWERYKLHNAANLLHVEQNYRVSETNPLAYKVAWVGGCVMYNTEKLKAVGGFDFWRNLPEQHCGEDVLAQLRVMKKFGGCGLIPSGVYHQEHMTTIPDRKINAPEVLEI